MSWFAAFMLKGIGVCVILAVAATIAGVFIKVWKMTFIYEIAEVQYMALVMIVPAIYLIAGFICNAGNKK